MNEQTLVRIEEQFPSRISGFHQNKKKEYTSKTCEFRIHALKDKSFKPIGNHKSFDMAPFALKISSSHELDMGHGYTLRFKLKITPADPIYDALLYKKETVIGGFDEEETHTDVHSSEVSTGSNAQEKLEEAAQALKELGAENEELKKKVIDLSSEL